jgi:signal peptidase I
MIAAVETSPGTPTGPSGPSGPGRISSLSSLLVLPVVAAAVSLFAWTMLPALIGWSPSVVLTGSMRPAIQPGDIVITAPVVEHTLRPGYIIRFRDPSEPGRHLMHRIVRINADGTIVTRGDANASDDSTPVPPTAVTGMARMRVPWVGLPVIWARERRVVPLTMVAGFVLIAMLATGSRRAPAADPIPARHRAQPRHRRPATGAHRRGSDPGVA